MGQNSSRRPNKGHKRKTTTSKSSASTQKNKSAPATRKQSSRTVEKNTPNTENVTQSREKQPSTDPDKEKFGKLIAKYLILTSSSGLPILRFDIMRCVLPEKTRCYPDAMKEANKILNKLFALEIVSLDEKDFTRADKVFLKSIARHRVSTGTTPRETLLTLILMAIQVNGSSITDEVLTKYLTALHIDRETKYDEVFGNVNEHISFFKSAMYLTIQHKKTEDNEKYLEYTWGSRALLETNVPGMFKFLQALYPAESAAILVRSFDKQFQENLQQKAADNQ